MKRLQEVGLTVAGLLTRLVYRIINYQARLALALQRYTYASPLRLLALTVGSVFLAELVIMLVLYLWSPFSLFEDVLLDTFLLSFLILPLIYLFLFHPFTLNLRELREQNEALERSRETVQAERQRFEAQIRYQAALIENVSDAIVSTGPNFHIQSWNKAAEAIYGWSAVEVIGQPTEAIFKTQYRPGEREAAILKLSETGHWEGEVIQQRKDGTLLNIQSAVSVIKDEAGQSIGAVAVNRDITARKRAEEIIKLSEANLAHAQAIAHLGNWSWDAVSGMVSWSAEMFRIYGVAPQEFDGNLASVVRCIHPTDIGKHEQAIAAAVAGNPVAPFEYRVIRPDGLERVVEVMAEARRDADGQFCGMFGTVLDITERKQAEMEIRSLAQFPNENPNPVLRISRDGVILYANRSSQEWLETWHAQIGSRIPPVWQETISHLLEAGNLEEMEIDIGDKLFAVTCASFPESGYVNLYGRDITQRKRAEVELRVSEEKLKVLFKLLPAGLSILNEERQIVEVNPALAKILDISEEGLIQGRYEKRAYLRADGTPMPSGEFPSIRAFKEQRIVENVEIGVTKENGVTFWTNVSAVPLPFPDWRVVVITSDLTERKQAEAERERLLEQARRDQEAIETLARILQRERDTLQTIMENTRAHLAYLDTQLNFVRVNSTYATGSGYTAEELIGRNHFELFPNPENQAIFEQVRETGEPIAFHAKPFEFADQPERGITYWDWTLSPVKDDKGRVQGLVLSLLDVTETKQTEERIRQALVEAQQHETEISALLLGSRAVLNYRDFEPAAQFLFSTCQHLVGATVGFISVLAPDGALRKIVSTEPACPVDPMQMAPLHQLQGQQAGEVIFENNFSQSEWTDSLPPGHDPLNNILFAPLKIDQEIVGWLNLANKPGGFTENEARMAAAFSELVAIALFNSRTLESLENSETRFRSVAQSAGEGIITIDSQGKIVFWNRAATTMLDYTADEALGQSLTFIIPAEFRAAHRQGLERLVAGEVPRLIGKTVEVTGLKKDGSELPLELSLSTWKVRGEVFFTGLIHDITERKQAEIALRRSHQELEQRVQERTAELAHINQTLEQRVKERTRELATLLEASHNLASTLDMEQLLGLILDQLKRVLDCSGVLIFRVEGEMLVALAHRGPIPPQEVAELHFLLRYAPAYQQVILQRTPVIIPDVRGDTPLARCYRESVGERLETTFAYVRSWLGVPLMVQEQVIGMLGLHHKQSNVYTARHAELALAFATQAAVAIENARLYKQAQELAAMQERQRLARDLHDSVSQSLFSASLSAEVLPRLWERHPEEGRRCLAELHRLTRGALAEMRTLLLELRPTALVETALGDLLSQLAEAMAGRARLPVIRSIEPYPPLPPEVQVALYRISQETLNNVVKHAGASRVEVSLRSTSSLIGSGELKNGVELRISDDGRGFEAGNVPPVCLGLSIMRERAETIGAALEIKSQIGQGTQVFVVWPGP